MPAKKELKELLTCPCIWFLNKEGLLKLIETSLPIDDTLIPPKEESCAELDWDKKLNTALPPSVCDDSLLMNKKLINNSVRCIKMILCQIYEENHKGLKPGFSGHIIAPALKGRAKGQGRRAGQ
jgi:hypothetical protein